MHRLSYPARRRKVRPARPALLPALLAGLLLLAPACRTGGDAPASARTPAADSTTARDSSASSTADSTDADALTVLVFGNSLTAGYGLSDPETQAFPALLKQKADSAGLSGVEVVNAGNSGETTAGGRRRIDWLLRRPGDVDVLILELGANDALRGLPIDSARANLQAIIDATTKRFPDAKIVLAGMKAPPNLGQAYTQRFAQIFPALAEANDAHLIPFLLEDVAGRPALNQADGLHPTAEGQRIVARNVWDVLAPLLREMQSAQAETTRAAG